MGNTIQKWEDLNQLLGLSIPLSIASLPIETDAAILAQKLQESGEDALWLEMGGCDFWKQQENSSEDEYFLEQNFEVGC